LALKKVGDELDIMPPMGQGFGIYPEYKKPLVIGGGIGVFPMFYLCKNMPVSTVILGFRNKDAVVMENDFSGVADKLIITTDDGSYKRGGLVTVPAEEEIKNGCDIIYACGPLPMLKAVKELSEKYGIPARISLEQRMGCGVGACLVCTCKANEELNVRVCKDGPCFWANEVTL